MKIQCTAWYSKDGTNPHIKPFARVVTVDCISEGDAVQKSEKELETIYEQIGDSVDFIGWFFKMVQA